MHLMCAYFLRYPRILINQLIVYSSKLFTELHDGTQLVLLLQNNVR